MQFSVQQIFLTVVMIVLLLIMVSVFMYMYGGSGQQGTEALWILKIFG